MIIDFQKYKAKKRWQMATMLDAHIQELKKLDEQIEEMQAELAAGKVVELSELDNLLEQKERANDIFSSQAQKYLAVL